MYEFITANQAAITAGLTLLIMLIAVFATALK